MKFLYRVVVLMSLTMLALSIVQAKSPGFSLNTGVSLSFTPGTVLPIGGTATAVIAIQGGHCEQGGAGKVTITGTGGPVGVTIPSATANLPNGGTILVTMPNQPGTYTYTAKVNVHQGTDPNDHSTHTDVSSNSVTLTVYTVTDISITGATGITGSSPEIFVVGYDPCTDPNTADDYVVLTAVTDPVVSQADVTLGWSGGEAISPADSLKRRVKRNQAALTDVSISGLGLINVPVHGIAVVKIGLTLGATTIYPNTDDDDHSVNPNATPAFDGSDLNEVPVVGENDLVCATLTVEPSTVNGVIALDLSAANKLCAYANNNKSGTLPTSWDLASVTAPIVVYVEGRDLSAITDDQTLKMNYDWGVHLETSTQATVRERMGTSEATLKFYTIQGSAIGNEVTGTIGGKKYVVLELTIGQGERLVSSGPVELQIREETTVHDTSNMHVEKSLDLTNPSQWEQGYELTGGTIVWKPATFAPASDRANNKSGSLSLHFRAKVEWDTANEPKLEGPYPRSHNATHNVYLRTVNGMATNALEFQHYTVPNGWQSVYTSGPATASVALKNVVITNASGNVGNADYIFCDTANPNTAYSEPQISFTIDDIADGHTYAWFVYIRDTRETNWVEYKLINGIHTGPGTVTATWNGKNADGSDADWGTYTFEIQVYDYMDNDYIYYKTDFAKVGLHSVELLTFDDSEDDPVPDDQLFAHYILKDSKDIELSSLYIDTISPELTLKNHVTGLPCTLDTTIDEYTYTFAPEDSLGTYITIFGGVDDHAADYREHTNRRIYAFNKRIECFGFYIENGTFTVGENSAPWYGVWVRRKYIEPLTGYRGPTGTGLATYVDETLFNANDNKQKERAFVAVNGQLFCSGVPVDQRIPYGFCGQGAVTWDHNATHFSPFPATSQYGDGVVRARYGFYYAPFNSGCKEIHIAADIHRPATATSWYDDDAKSDAHQYGFSGIACLRLDGATQASTTPQCSSWPSKDTQRPRTFIGWSQKSPANRVSHFYMVATGNGLTWDNTVSFVTTQQIYGTGPMRSAMMLDGGGSTTFIFRHYQANRTTSTDNINFGSTDISCPTYVYAKD